MMINQRNCDDVLYWSGLAIIAGCLGTNIWSAFRYGLPLHTTLAIVICTAALIGPGLVRAFRRAHERLTDAHIQKLAAEMRCFEAMARQVEEGADVGVAVRTMPDAGGRRH